MAWRPASAHLLDNRTTESQLLLPHSSGAGSSAAAMTPQCLLRPVWRSAAASFAAATARRAADGAHALARAAVAVASGPHHSHGATTASICSQTLAPGLEHATGATRHRVSALMSAHLTGCSSPSAPNSSSTTNSAGGIPSSRALLIVARASRRRRLEGELGNGTGAGDEEDAAQAVMVDDNGGSGGYDDEDDGDGAVGGESGLFARRSRRGVFYGIAVGRKTGVFYSWAEVEPCISGFSGALHKKFSTEQEARAFVQRHVTDADRGAGDGGGGGRLPAAMKPQPLPPEHIGPFYAVARGRKVGIFLTWPETQAAVTGVPGSSYKRFTTRAEALSYLEQHSRPPGEDVGTSPGTETTAPIPGSPSFRGAPAPARRRGRPSKAPLRAAAAAESDPTTTGDIGPWDPAEAEGKRPEGAHSRAAGEEQVQASARPEAAPEVAMGTSTELELGPGWHEQDPDQATFYYAVAKGKQVGVFTSWPEARAAVQGVTGAKFKKFKHLSDAYAYLTSSGIVGGGQTQHSTERTEPPGAVGGMGEVNHAIPRQEASTQTFPVEEEAERRARREPRKALREAPASAPEPHLLLDFKALQAAVDPARVYRLEFDGGSRRNPGDAGFGAVLVDAASGHHVEYVAGPLAASSNNLAEWSALVAGLEVAIEMGVRHLTVQGDSELVCRQVSGRYGVNTRALQPLAARVSRLKAGLDSFEVRHVPRSENAVADLLSNLAMDAEEAVAPLAVGSGQVGPKGRRRRAEREQELQLQREMLQPTIRELGDRALQAARAVVAAAAAATLSESVVLTTAASTSSPVADAPKGSQDSMRVSGGSRRRGEVAVTECPPLLAARGSAAGSLEEFHRVLIALSCAGHGLFD